MISVKAKIEGAGVNLDSFSTGVIEAFQKEVGHVARAAHGEWIRLAQERLTTSRGDYINGLQQAGSFGVRIVGPKTVFEIQLIGRMPNNFEFGMEGFDMKAVRPGWLGGGKSKVSKDGHRYITIPFRHSLTSAARLAYSGKAKRDNLKAELTRVVKLYGLDKMVKSATGVPLVGSVARVPHGTPTHPTPVHPYLKGLTRVQGPARGGKVQGQLFTWRVMSEKSSPTSWVHPGIKAANLMGEVENFIDHELDTLIDRIFGVRS